MSTDLRGGADSAPLNVAPPRVLIVVSGASPGCGSSMVAATIADAATGLVTADGEPVTVTLLYPSDDYGAEDLKAGASAMTARDPGVSVGVRASGAKFARPEQESDTVPANEPHILGLDASTTYPDLWLETSAATTACVVVPRPSIPSIRDLAFAIHDLPDTVATAFAITAATSGTPQLVAALTEAGQSPDLVAAYFPADPDLTETGIPTEFPPGQLNPARHLLADLGILQGVPV